MNADDGLKQLVTAWAKSQLPAASGGAELYQRLLLLIEPPLFQAAVEHHRGQVATASRVLGLHRTTLKKKLDEYGIEEGMKDDG